MDTSQPSTSPAPPPNANTSLLPSYSTARIHTLPRIDDARLRRARGIVLLAFALVLGTLAYGLLRTPDLGQVAHAHKHAFTPNGWAALVFLIVHAGLQLWWARELFLHDEVNATALDALPYVPSYAFANVCAFAWVLFFLHRYFACATIAAALYLVTQGYGVALLSLPTHASLPTHLVVKSSAALGLLAVLNSGANWLQISSPPSTLVKALAGTLFGFISLTNDPIFGAGLLYDLVALSVEQPKPWSRELTWMALGVGGVVLVKTLVFRIY